MSSTTRREDLGTGGATVRRARRKAPPEPVGALRPGLAARGGSDDPSSVGSLRPGLRTQSARPASPAGETSPDREIRLASGAVAVEDPCPGTAAMPEHPSAPWLRQAPLVLIGAALAALGGAVARGTGGIAAAPAVVAGLRIVSYVGLVLAAGSLAFAALAWPEGLRARRLAVSVWSGWLVTVLATVGQLIVRDTSAIPPADGGRVVTALGVRLAVLLAAVVWATATLTGRAAPGRVGVALGVVLAGTWVYAGPAAPGWLTVVVTIAHIGAACVWLGGLVVLAVVLLPRGAAAPMAGPLSSFSRLATVCVATLAVSGAFHGWRRAGSLGGLFTTGYGHAFWLKLAAVAAMLVVANGNRLYVLRHVESRPRAADAAPPLHVFGLFLGAEIAFGAVVMVLTGILVGAPVDG